MSSISPKLQVAKNATKKAKQYLNVSFSDVTVIEFPYTVGDTPCSAGVPIGASYVAQRRTTFQLDFFEEHRPARRPKAQLHISPMDRKAILLKSGHTTREISAATRDAMRVRKQRAETIQDLRSRMQSLAVEEANSAVTFDSSLGMGSPASPRTNANTCPSPVAMSPIRANGRTRWTPCRQDKPLRMRRRRLSETRSPMPLKISTDGNKPRPSVLSPLRTKTKLSFSPKGMSPARRPVHSPMPTQQQRSPFACLSPKMARRNHPVGDIGNQRNETPKKQGKLTPRKRPFTPTNKSDKPLSVPTRMRTPPPSCNLRATRMI